MTEFAELKNYVDDKGRLISWPSKRSLQLVALEYLAQKLDAGKTYSERDINTLLNRWHTFSDPALLRRELYELGRLNRSKNGAEYWATPQTKLM